MTIEIDAELQNTIQLQQVNSYYAFIFQLGAPVLFSFHVCVAISKTN